MAVLRADQVEDFRRDGVLVAPGILDDSTLARVRDGISRWVQRRAEQLGLGDVASDETFERRYATLHHLDPRLEHGIDVMWSRIPEVFELLRHAPLLDAATQLLGTGELAVSPIQHLRAKVHDPTETSYLNVPWHQDQAVTWEEADESEIVTCWIALADATVENGCMQVLPGVWRHGLLPHAGDAYGETAIRPHSLPDVAARAAETPAGGVVFMHRCTPHRSAPNRTGGVRWSLDVRYQPTGTPTGRPWLPSFVACSTADPASVCTSFDEWDRTWAEALAAPVPDRPLHRIEG